MRNPTRTSAAVLAVLVVAGCRGVLGLGDYEFEDAGAVGGSSGWGGSSGTGGADAAAEASAEEAATEGATDDGPVEATPDAADVVAMGKCPMEEDLTSYVPCICYGKLVTEADVAACNLMLVCTPAGETTKCE